MPRFWSRAIAVAGVSLCVACAHTTQEPSVVGEYLSGRFAARVHDMSSAAKAFNEARQSDAPRAEISRDAFFFQLAAGDMDAAMALAEKLARDPESGDDGLARLALAAKYLKNENYAKARAILAEGVEAPFMTSTAFIVDAWASAGLNGPGAAIEILSDPPADEFKGFMPLHLALLAEKAGRADDAISAHRLSIMTYGGPIGRAAYGAALERSADSARAREFYQLLAEDAGPERQIALQGLSRLDAGEKATAYRNLSPAEGAAIAYYTLGGAILQEATNQRAAAERAGFNVGDANYNLPLIMCQLAIYLDPKLDEALRMAGSIFNVYGEHEQAMAMFGRIRASSPYFEQARIEMAGGLADQGEWRRAVGVLKRTIRAEGEMREARLMLANIYASQDSHKDAVKTLNRLIAKLPDDAPEDAWRYYIARAASLLALDRWPDAERDLKRAVQIAPEEATTLNYLGYSWAERGLHLDKAFELIEKAVALEPNSGAIIDSLGWAHYQLGDYQEAVGHLEQAAALEPADPTVTDHLGDVYWRLGRKIEARYQWERALELDPSDKQRAAIEQKLQIGLGEPGEDNAQEADASVEVIQADDEK